MGCRPPTFPRVSALAIGNRASKRLKQRTLLVAQSVQLSNSNRCRLASVLTYSWHSFRICTDYLFRQAAHCMTVGFRIPSKPSAFQRLPNWCYWFPSHQGSNIRELALDLLGMPLSDPMRSLLLCWFQMNWLKCSQILLNLSSLRN